MLRKLFSKKHRKLKSILCVALCLMLFGSLVTSTNVGATENVTGEVSAVSVEEDAEEAVAVEETSSESTSDGDTTEIQGTVVEDDETNAVDESVESVDAEKSTVESEIEVSANEEEIELAAEEDAESEASEEDAELAVAAAEAEEEETVEALDASEKTLMVDADSEEVVGDTYTTIQGAIDYIASTDDKDGWTITVKSGDYTTFTVNQYVSNLTIVGEEGATVDTNGGSIQLMGNTITLSGLTFIATDTAWSVPVIKDASSNAGIFYDSMVTITDCSFVGSNAACAIWICRLNATVSDCTFSGFSYALEIINETSTAAKIDTVTTTGTITIDNNTVTDCDFFIHYGVRAGIDFVVTNNTVTGSADKVCASLFAWDGASIIVTGNTFNYSAFGLQNASDGTSAESFLSTNTFDEHSYVVDDYYNYATKADYSATYYAPDVEGKTPVWSVSNYTSGLALQFVAALSDHENDNPLTFTTTDGEGDQVCMGLAYHAINLNYKEESSGDGGGSSDTDLNVSKSKEATQLNDDYESDVTISLPSASYEGELDVAFVLDGSTSHDNTNLAEAAAALLDELVAIDNLTVKVSVTVFGGSTPILETTDLLELTEDNVTAIKNFLTTDYKSMEGRSGSNLQAGVEKARSLLNGDTEVSGSDKYMVILTDGAARMWYDTESGEAVSQTYLPEKTIFWNSNEDWTHRYGTTDSSSLRSFSSIWTAGQTGTVIGNYAMTYSQYLNASVGDSGIASWETVANGVDYYTTYEAACYYAATSIVAASQEVNVCMVTYQYHNDKNYGTFTEDFKSWLESYVTRYDIGTEENVDAETAAAVFSQVKDELIQLVDSGSAVVDEMGETDEYDFDFINDINRLTLTVDGEALAVTQIDETTYGFGDTNGSADGTTYPFVLRYYADGLAYQGTAYGECYLLEINVPITKNNQVKLTYGVVLTNPQTEEGSYGTYDQYGDDNDGSESYGLYTNNKAVLYPVDSNGNSLPPQEFQKPTVSYTVTEDTTVIPKEEESEEDTGKTNTGSEVTDTATDTTTNTTSSSASAKTGDTNTAIYWILIAAAACAVVFTVSGKRKHS